MRQKQILIISLTLLTLTSFVLHQALLIVPGQSVGNFLVNKTTLKQVKSTLGNGEIKRLKWKAPDCGMTYPYYKLVYPDKGISFTFYTREVKNSDKFETIELTKKFDAKTEKQITVGYSTRADIISAYGQPTSKNNDRYLAYENLGISFEFVNLNNQMTDTLTKVYIYKQTETDEK